MTIGAEAGGAAKQDLWPGERTPPGATEARTRRAARISVFYSFDEAQSVWRSFERHAEGYVFQRYDWLRSWHEFIGAGPDLCVCITVVECPEGAPAMLLPLAVERRGPVRCLVWLGGKITDYCAPLLARDCPRVLDLKRFALLWREIRDRLPRHDAVILEKQPEFVGSQENPFFHLAHAPSVGDAHFTHLGGEYESFLRAKRSNHWLNLERKKERGMAKRGKLLYRVAGDPAEALRILQETMRQKSQGYRALGVPDLFADPRYRRFFVHMSARHLRDGLVHASALMLDDRVIATHWGLLHQGRFYCYLPAHARDELSRYSPGNALLRRLFEWCIAHGVQVFDFTIGDEIYKYGWCDRELRMFDCIHAVTPRGWLYATTLQRARRVKRWVLRSPLLRRPARSLRTRLGRIWNRG